MYWSAHLIIPFILINIAVAYVILLLIKKPNLSKSFLYATFLIICVSGVLLNLYDFWVVFHWSYDTWVQLTLINETINNGLFPRDPFFQNQPNILYYSILHSLCAELYFFVEVPPHVLLIVVSSLALLLRIIFLFVWVRYLLNDEKSALLAISIYVISNGSFFGSTFHFLWYPFSMGLTISNLTFLFMFKSFKENKFRLKSAFVSAIFFSVVTMFHLVMGVFLFFAIMGFLLFYIIIKGKPQRGISYSLIIIFTVGIVLALFWLGWIVPPYLTEAQSHSNLSTYGTSTTNWFRFSWTNRYITLGLFNIVNPRYLFFNVFNKNLILITLIVAGFYKFLKDFDALKATKNDLYILSNSIIPVILSFTPPLFSLLFNVLLRGYVIRLLVILPQTVLATIGLQWIGAVTLKKISLYKLKTRFKNVPKEIVLFFLIFLIMGISSLPKYVYYVNREAEQRSMPLVFEWEKDFKWLKNNSDREDVILSDPWTSYYIPYFAERKIVAMLPEHSPTFSIDYRVSDALLVLNMSTPLDETLAIIKKYNVSYVLLNLRPFLDTKFEGYRQYIETYYSLRIPSKFYSASGFFKEAYCVNGVWIFEVL